LVPAASGNPQAAQQPVDKTKKLTGAEFDKLREIPTGCCSSTGDART
jgi:hypothetical protein